MQKTLEQILEENQVTETEDGQLYIGAIDKKVPWPKGPNPGSVIDGIVRANQRIKQVPPPNAPVRTAGDTDPLQEKFPAVGKNLAFGRDSVLGFLEPFGGGAVDASSPVETAKNIGKGVMSAADTFLVKPLTGQGTGDAQSALMGMLTSLAEAPGKLWEGAKNRDQSQFAEGLGGTAGEAVAAVEGVKALKPHLPNSIPSETITARVAAPSINESLRIPKRLQSANIDPGRQLIEDGFFGTQRGALKHMEAQMEKLGPQIENKLTMDNPGATIDGAGIVNAPLDKASRSLVYGSDPAFAQRIENIKAKILEDYPNLQKLTPLEAQKLKSYIGEQIKWSDEMASPHEMGINEALTDIYSGLREEIGIKVPSVKADLARWGNYEVGRFSLDKGLNADRFRTSGVLRSLKDSTVSSMPVQTGLGKIFRNPLPAPERSMFSDPTPRDPITGDILMEHPEGQALLPGTRTRNPRFQLPENRVTDTSRRDPVTQELLMPESHNMEQFEQALKTAPDAGEELLRKFGIQRVGPLLVRNGVPIGVEHGGGNIKWLPNR